MITTLFPELYTVFPSDNLCTSTKSGAEGLIAVSIRVRACKRRYNLQFYDDCIRAEIPTMKALAYLLELCF